MDFHPHRRIPLQFREIRFRSAFSATVTVHIWVSALRRRVAATANVSGEDLWLPGVWTFEREGDVSGL